MTASSPAPLTPSGRRSLAAAMIRSAVPDTHPLVATMVVDLLDNVSGCILGGIGISPLESRLILGTLWLHDRSTD